MGTNTQTQHTLGPWRVSSGQPIEVDMHKFFGYKQRFYKTVKSEKILAHVYGFSVEETEANAQLIASAPDLLKENQELKEELFQARVFISNLGLKKGELEEAGRNVLEASNQYTFFLDGYASGSASIAECNHAADELHKAQTVLFELLNQKQP